MSRCGMPPTPKLSTMTQSYRRKISGIMPGSMPGMSLSRNTRGFMARPNSTGPVGQGEGT